MLGARLRWQSKNQEGLLGFSRSINFFCTATKLNLPLLVGLHGSSETKSRKWALEEKMLWKVTRPFTFTFIYIWSHVRSVSFSDGVSRDRDTIFRDRRYLVLNLFPWLFWWSFRHAKLTTGGEERARIPGIEFVCFFSFFLPTFSIFAWSNEHTHTNKGGAHEETRKGRKETLESSSLHPICGLQINVWLGAFN